MATSPTITFGVKNKSLFKSPILEIGALLTDTYFQETPRSIHSKNEEYVGIDIFPGKGVDHVINLCKETQIPEHWLRNGGYFNTIHCHCVMEHVTDIFTMAKNIEKITKVGGVLYISVPFSWKIHRIPLDMWRFTPQSIDYLFPLFEFKTDLCCSSTRKNDLHSINHFPEFNMGKGLAELNPLLRFIIKVTRKLKLDNGYFSYRSLFPEININMIGIKRYTKTYTFIDDKYNDLI